MLKYEMFTEFVTGIFPVSDSFYLKYQNIGIGLQKIEQLLLKLWRIKESIYWIL